MKTSTVILVYKKGGDYHYSDVYLLVTNIRKQWDRPDPLNIICITDMVKESQHIGGCLFMPFPVEAWERWWSKMNLFAPQLKQHRPFMFFDLDTAIVGPLSGIFPEGPISEGFITLEDFYRPKRLASGMMWIPDNKYMDYVFEEWMVNPAMWIRKYRGDQDFLGAVVKADYFWQRITDKISTFKPKKGWLMELPYHLSVVCFHGQPRIPKAAQKVQWVKNYIG